MSTETNPFDKIRDLVDVAETYAADGATQTSAMRLAEARALIEGLLQPLPAISTDLVSLEFLIETVESARRRRSPEEIATVRWIANAIGLFDSRIRAMAEAAAYCEQQYRAALVEWIQQDRECTCVTHCDEDPATACSLSGKTRHVHSALPGQPGVYGPCPRHPDVPGDL